MSSPDIQKRRLWPLALLLPSALALSSSTAFSNDISTLARGNASDWRSASEQLKTDFSQHIFKQLCLDKPDVPTLSPERIAQGPQSMRSCIDEVVSNPNEDAAMVDILIPYCQAIACF